MSDLLKDEVVEVEIDELSDRDHVRKRKGMYLPDINYCVYEIVDNSIDEHSEGYGDTIYIKIDEERNIYVQDLGRGIPITPSKKNPNKTQAEVALTSLRAGGKFRTQGKGKTGGLNGVGASVVNMLSEVFSARITKDGIQYGLDCEKGIVINSLYEIGKVSEEDAQTGTLIMLRPDREIWAEDDDLDLSAINNRMRQLSYLNPGLTIITDFNYNGKIINETHYNPEGLNAYVNRIAENRTLLTPIFGFSKTIEDIDINIALTYSNAYSESIFVFTNNIANNAGGSHLTGFKEGLYNAIDNYISENADNKSKLKITSDDTREGLIGIISIKVKDPNYDGQGKGKINMPKVRAAVKKVLSEYIEEVLDKNPNVAKIIIDKISSAAKAREAAKRARDNIREAKTIGSSTLPGKLAQCISKDPYETEIWLVEGDSAGGTAKQARDKRTQAVLPIFGKIPNVEKARIETIINSIKMKDAVSAFGCGIADEFDIEKLKYRTIVISADADVDGSHIVTLWLTFFYRFFKPLIEEGCIYISCAPLYKITKNKKEVYAYTDVDKDNKIKELGGFDKIQRYKGLGEMNEEQLWESTMDPKRRKLIQVTLDNIEMDERMLITCMGEEVAPRREFIISSSRSILEEDVMDNEYIELEEI